MRIEMSRELNIMNITILAEWLGMPETVLRGYYDELIQDSSLTKSLAKQIVSIRKTGFQKGIFKSELNDTNVDWFGFMRILLYVLIRARRPKLVVETGVYYGGNSAFILRALMRNGSGRCISFELDETDIAVSRTLRHPWVGDSETYAAYGLKPGFIVPEYLRGADWRICRKNFLLGEPSVNQLGEKIDLFVHDSEHTFEHVVGELECWKSHAAPNSLAVTDDIDWSNGFSRFTSLAGLRPLLLTDNAKDGLRVRIGLLRLDHPDNDSRYLAW